MILRLMSDFDNGSVLETFFYCTISKALLLTLIYSPLQLFICASDFHLEDFIAEIENVGLHFNLEADG